MPHNPLTSLRQALNTNEFDIVGLADLPDEPTFLTQCLRNVATWLLAGREMLVTHDELAQVVHALVRVAQEEYGEGPGYWPHLEKRIAAVRANGQFNLNEARQGQLGSWFRGGLKAFHYPRPCHGLTNLGPILWHAGCPRQQLPRLLDFVVACVDRYGETALDADALVDLRLNEDAATWNPALPRTVVRLFNENPAGAGALWQRLAVAAHAWRQGGAEALREAWDELPGISAEDLLAGLGQLESASTQRESLPLRPRLRYDRQTGEVRLWLVDGRPTDWEVTGLKLRWEGPSALVLEPPPARFTIRHRETGHRWEETSWIEEQPAIFFTSPAGALERAEAIAGRGLEAGPWHLLAKGQPAGFTPEQRRPLAWTSLQGGAGWAAWEVEVPSPGSQRTWTLTLSGQSLEVPLARRSGPRLQLPEGLVTAHTSDGTPVSVFAAAPAVQGCTRDLTARLLQRQARGAALIASVALRTRSSTTLPVAKPGVYQLRDSRGSGRVLLDFAVIPGLTVQGPHLEGEQVHLQLRATPGTGELRGRGVETVRPGSWHLVQATTEPWLTAEWRWPGEKDFPLSLNWPVTALRWRVLHLGDDLATWTCQTRLVDRRRIAPAKAVLQVQVPPQETVSINGVAVPPERRQPSPTGDVIDIELLGYTNAEALWLQVDGVEHRLLLLAERPLLKELDAAQRHGRLHLAWKAEHLPAGTLVVAWDPSDPAGAPLTLPLDGPHRQGNTWVGPQNWPPGGQAVSVTLAIKVGGGFGLAAARLQPAIDQQGHPLCQLVLPEELEQHTRAWLQLLHQWSVLLRWGGSLSAASPAQEAPTSGPFPVALVRNFLTGLAQVQSSAAGSDWRQLRSELEEIFAVRAVPYAVQELPGADNPTAKVLEWLAHGIHLGWRSPAEYLEVRASDEGYPLGYFRDLWSLNSTTGVEIRRTAAERIWSIHAELVPFSPAAGLPLARVQALTRGELWFAGKSDRGHVHWLQPLKAEVDDADSFYRQVAVDDCYLDLGAIAQDQFPTSAGPPPRKEPATRRARLLTAGVAHYQPTRYTLGRLPEDTAWEIDRQHWNPQSQKMSSSRCCQPNGPLLAARWTGAELVQHLGLRQWLMTAGATVTIPDLDLPEALDDILFQQPELGAVHRELLEPAPVRPYFLLGQYVGERPAHEDIPEAGKLAWCLAWLDRLAAQRGPAKVFTGSAQQRQFLQALQCALQTRGEWGRLLTGCLVSAEYILTILGEGGLGPAFRFGR